MMLRPHGRPQDGVAQRESEEEPTVQHAISVGNARLG